MSVPTSLRTVRPQWLRAPARAGDSYRAVRAIVEDLKLHTVCESAICPNLGECWSRRTATFMILGDVCTRRCSFCAVGKGAPAPLDDDEPRRVAEAAAALGLRYAVLTSVSRDDLPDGGASLFARTIRALRQRLPGCKVEVLIPDFQGSHSAMDAVLAAAPDVLNHNVETVPRLYTRVRPDAGYTRSLGVLEYSKTTRPEVPTKSGLMVGLGETNEEILQVMRDLREKAVDILTIGQYLQPSRRHLPIQRYVTPDEFSEFQRVGLEMGFAHVESAPLVRSSYHAAEAARPLE